MTLVKLLYVIRTPDKSQRFNYRARDKRREKITPESGQIAAFQRKFSEKSLPDRRETFFLLFFSLFLLLRRTVSSNAGNSNALASKVATRCWNRARTSAATGAKVRGRNKRW